MKTQTYFMKRDNWDNSFHLVQTYENTIVCTFIVRLKQRIILTVAEYEHINKHNFHPIKP